MQQSLTVKEALEQGYEYYVYNSDGYQSLKNISDVEDINFKRDDVFIVDKEPYHPTGINSKDIAMLIADHLEDHHVSESGDDTQNVYNTIKELDFSEAEEKISEALEKMNYYKASNIKLIP